ncbi:nucleophile aminohydrolase [Mycena floridula]|nr:nucleophile aminohydrolase [Mycena floridula]
MSTVIAVHGGAGLHTSDTEKAVKRACSRAVKQALRRAQEIDAASALELVEQAIMILEDDPCLNAGLGSNLTLDGTVECDASLMDDKSFGAVAAVAGIRNPIQLARLVHRYSLNHDPIGRIPPLTLVGDGALRFASKHSDIATVPPGSLITPKAFQDYSKWKSRLLSNSDGDLDGYREVIQDTVGAVALHGGRLAAGVSSGGILLKHPGRLGEGATFGAGCWAENYKPSTTRLKASACSLSGAGEQIIRTDLARSLGTDLGQEDIDVHQVLQLLLQDKFWKPCIEGGDVQPNAGVLLLTLDDEDKPRLWCAFTTPSMAIAYVSSTGLGKPTAMILRREEAHVRLDAQVPHIFITSISL